jgi:hypothetical protein
MDKCKEEYDLEVIGRAGVAISARVDEEEIASSLERQNTSFHSPRNEISLGHVVARRSKHCSLVF